VTHTRRIALTDPQVLQCVTTVVAVRPDAFATAESPFFSGGGGQPADIGSVSSGGRNAAITGVSVDDADLLWHETTTPPPLGSSVDLVVDRPRRRLISRMHTALHVLNTLALQHYGAWTTGAQITIDYGRLDISATELTPALVDDLETKMNAVLTAYHAVQYLFLAAADAAQRPDILRTKNVQPPVYRGQISVVEIVGFDAQACGGTHAESTHVVGPCVIYKSENKGRENKRLYVRFAD
jgi:misacylated tRNA(Ala) deacylase